MLKKCLAMGWSIALACVAALLLATPAAAKPPERPVLMLFHGGGFVFDDLSRMRVATEFAGELGFDVAYVDYPLFDLRGAITAAENRARALRSKGRQVFAYGDSAGGTLAALLAQKGLVEAAAAHSPVADVRLFAAHLEDPAGYIESIDADRRLLRQASPALHPTDNPIFVMRPVAESRYASVAMRRWGNSDPLVHVEAVPGVHTSSLQPAFYGRNVTLAMRWLMRRR